MKLTDVTANKGPTKVDPNANKKVFYFEFYPHYSGDNLIRKFATTVGALDQLYAASLAAKKNPRFEGKFNKRTYTYAKPKTAAEKMKDERYAAGWNAVEAIEKSMGHNYALHDAMEKWPAVRRVVIKGGTWGAQWEEGSHAMSGKSMKDAIAKVKKIERKVAADERDSDIDD